MIHKALKLKPNILVCEHENSIIFKYLSTEYEINKSDEIIDCIFQLTTRNSDSSEKIKKSPRIDKFISLLFRYNLLAQDTDTFNSNFYSGEWFYKIHREYCEYWLETVYDHPFWSVVISGAATKNQIIGFALEKYHYIEAAHEHMAFAAASDFSRKLQPHLARHFIEEYSHGDIYRRGLHAFFSDEEILNSLPLPTTRALVNYLNELAHGDTFAYYSANEVLQMTENVDVESEFSGVNKFNEEMLKHYPYSKPLVEAFNKHTKLDQDLGHEYAYSLMCKSYEKLTSREVISALNAAKKTIEILCVFLDGIQKYYHQPPHGLFFETSIDSEIILDELR